MGICRHAMSEETCSICRNPLQMEPGLEDLQRISVSTIYRRLREGAKVVNDKETDFSLRSLAAIARLKATDRAKDATQVIVLRSLTDDAKVFQKYLTVSLPHLDPRNTIKNRKEKSDETKAD